MRQPKDYRLFFALWPDATLRAQLQQAAERVVLDDTVRRVPPTNLHLTLHFIGNVERDEMACLQAQARLVSGAAFQLVIDRQGRFDKARVGWLGCSSIPESLVGLQRQLGERLQTCRFVPETRPYNPHVTVARKVRHLDPKAIQPLHWQVQNFALVESTPRENGVHYAVVETYPLR